MTLFCEVEFFLSKEILPVLGVVVPRAGEIVHCWVRSITFSNHVDVDIGRVTRVIEMKQQPQEENASAAKVEIGVVGIVRDPTILQRHEELKHLQTQLNRQLRAAYCNQWDQDPFLAKIPADVRDALRQLLGHAGGATAWLRTGCDSATWRESCSMLVVVLPSDWARVSRKHNVGLAMVKCHKEFFVPLANSHQIPRAPIHGLADGCNVTFDWRSLPAGAELSYDQRVHGLGGKTITSRGVFDTATGVPTQFSSQQSHHPVPLPTAGAAQQQQQPPQPPPYSHTKPQHIPPPPPSSTSSVTSTSSAAILPFRAGVVMAPPAPAPAPHSNSNSNSSGEQLQQRQQPHSDRGGGGGGGASALDVALRATEDLSREETTLLISVLQHRLESSSRRRERENHQSGGVGSEHQQPQQQQQQQGGYASHHHRPHIHQHHAQQEQPPQHYHQPAAPPAPSYSGGVLPRFRGEGDDYFR